MILTRLTADDPTDTLPSIPPARFADPRLEYCGDTDEQLITAALLQVTALIHRAARSLVLYPDHRALQASFVTLIGQRDQLERHLLSCS